MFRGLLCALLIAGASSVALAQGDLNDVYGKLKEADEKKDNAEVKKLAVQALQLSSKILKSAQPPGESDPEVWKTTQAQAKDVKTYAEYALDAAVLRAPEPAEKIDLFETLEKEAPDSKYLPQLYTPVLGAYAKMKPDKSFAFAQRAISKDPNNEDLLLVLTAGSFDRKQYDATANYGTKLAKSMATHPRPEGVAAADWDRKKNLMAGRGYWLAGMAYAAQGKYPQAAESLKASLPFVASEHELTAGAQFTIGLADYNLARATQDKALMQEALKYSQMAATSSSAYNKQAAQNAYAIKQELARMR